MINVTIGESKTQEVKPFPKLMIGEYGTIIEVLQLPNEHGCAHVVIRKSNQFPIGFRADFRLKGSVEMFDKDYNEPITLQNA